MDEAGTGCWVELVQVSGLSWYRCMAGVRLVQVAGVRLVQVAGVRLLQVAGVRLQPTGVRLVQVCSKITTVYSISYDQMIWPLGSALET